MTAMPEPTWDLSDLYAGPADPAIEADKAAAIAAADAFGATYRGRIGQLSGRELRAAFEAFEALIRVAGRPRHYASLRYALAADDPAAQAAVASAQAFGADLEARLAFWSVELKAVTGERLAAMEDVASVDPYRHYLEYQQQFAPFTLTEEAEATTSRKDLTGKVAWVNLYTQLSAGLEFQIEVDGEAKTMTRGEVRALMLHDDREVRDRAVDSIANAFEPKREVLGFVFNTLFEDHRLEVAARGYDGPMHYPVLHDDLQRPVVDSLLQTATASFPLVHRYHALRKRVLDLPDYGTQDLRLPAFGQEPAVAWPRASELVLEAFDSFDAEAGTIARRFFDERWLDVFGRKGKTSGAFCSPGLPPSHPWVLLNYADTLDDVFTLAHELGHGLHMVLSCEQTPLNYGSGTPLAETASVFAELWLHERLMKDATDPALRRQLLDRQVRDAVGTAFHQVAYINWERRAHLGRTGGVLSGPDMCRMWTEEMARLLGDGVVQKERDGWRWITIPHFVFARFYCYSYAFGKLLTLALHGLWKERGPEFVTSYRALLAAGGSRAPADLFGELGLDLADPGFWQRGCDVVEGWVDELESLV